MRFYIWKSKNDEIYFELQGNNGETVAVSELYTRKQSAKDTIEAIKKGASTAGVSDMTEESKYDRSLP
jgi:uncharacterized protein YegP (UPF0339 family)